MTEKTPKDSLVGTRVREYEILDIIGKGGMGAVYRARHVYLDEERAIKVISGLQNAGVISDDSPFVNRFIREAKILTKLRHPNLVELYEFGRLEDSMFFMVMELIQGESVHQRMKKIGRIPIKNALKIVREAAQGLQLAHVKGIVHRDLSPDNLMLVPAPDGTEITKVIDFGIAKPTIEETHRFTVGNMFLGKPEFSSPEQCGFHEEGEEIDHRSDIYSLGITLYYMITGKLPFYSATPQGYLVKHASEAPKPLSAHFAPGELPEGVDRLIMKSLAKKRDERQSSMLELIQEIEAIATPPSKADTRPQPRLNPGELESGLLFARRYEIDKKIGRGGMGVVYKALDKFLDITVALKLMNPEIMEDERTLNRLKREVILARKVAHPNVCRIYDIGESDGIHYVSMELLDGMSLSELLLKEGALSLEMGLPILRQVLEALVAAHQAGIFHRDLKPQNIIVDTKGRAHIMDFGISTSADASKLTQTGALIGTPRYMAPEQFGGSNVDQRADIYSLGIIMFEMFTGMLPFEANTPASVMYAHLHSAPARPSQLAPSIPYGLEQIILKALEKDANNRYQTVSQFLSAVTSLDRGTSETISENLIPAAIAPKYVETPVPAMKGSVASDTPSTIPGRKTEAEAEIPDFPEPRAFSLKWIAAAIAVPVIAGIIWFATRSPKSEPSAEVQPQEMAPSVQQQAPPSVQNDNPPSPSPAVSEPATQAPAAVTMPPKQETAARAEPSVTQPAQQEPAAAVADGTVSYNGPYQISVYHNKQLVFNSAQSSSVKLPPGSYAFTVVGNEKAIIRQVQKIEVKSGETSAIQVPPMATLSVNANPSNCKVLIDGIFVDIPPIFDLPVQAGTHEIKVVWEKQGKEKVTSFDLAPGENKKIRAVIANDAADVSLESN